MSALSKHPETLVIGLVNNMPDAALRRTEQQFRALLAAAAGGAAIELRLFALPDIPRGEAARLDINNRYQNIDKLYDSRVDGLIVTGAEPRASSLRDEPYWPSLAKVVDWAEDNTASTIWSCLAAHAAVLHATGLARAPLGGKLFGVFECEKTDDHPIVDDMPACWTVPHSRYNALAEDALTAHGYRVLSRSPEAGADMFVKPGNSLFLMFQGHPEYDCDALARELRRDVARFLCGARDDFPELPRGCFDAAAVAEFAVFRQRAMADRHCDRLAELPMRTAIATPWRAAAVRLYANWITYLLGKRAGAQCSIEAAPMRVAV